MGINLITFYNSTVTPPDDALIYEKALPGSGMIYGGTVTIKNANTLHVAAGHGALCGRKFTIEETDVPVILTSSGTLNGRLYIHMDLSDAGEPISFQVERAATLTPVVQQSNVNINDGIYEINLATFTVSTSTVSDLVNVAPFIDDEVLETIIAPTELTSTASQNYAVGAHLIYKKQLYRVTSAITAGQTITPGSNVTVSNTIQAQIEDINSQKTNQTVIATRQANLTASRAYAIGDQFIYNNTLYKATAAISSGGAITIGGNATAAENITSQISNSQSLTYTLSSGFSNSSNNRTKIIKTANQIVIHLGVTYNQNISATTEYEVLTITDSAFMQKNYDIFGVAISNGCAWMVMLKNNKVLISKYVGSTYNANQGIFGQIALFNNA